MRPRCFSASLIPSRNTGKSQINVSWITSIFIIKRIFTQVCVQFATENGRFKLHWANVIPLCVHFLHHFVTAEHKNVRRLSLEMFTSNSATFAIPTFCRRHCLQRRQTGLSAALNDDWRKKRDSVYCLSRKCQYTLQGVQQIGGMISRTSRSVRHPPLAGNFDKCRTTSTNTFTRIIGTK